jgi:hypothetical protein
MVLRRTLVKLRVAPAGAVVLLIVGLVCAGGGWAVASSSPKVVALPVSSGVRPIIVPITPCRLVDTRAASHVGPRTTPLGAGETYTVTATGAAGNCAVPAGAVGLVTNVTAVHGTAGSFLTVWPADVARPAVSSLNWVAGQSPTPNQVTVGLSSTGTPGQVSFFNRAGSVDLVVDVVAYLADHNFDDRYLRAGPAPYLNPTATFAVGGSGYVAYDGANFWVTSGTLAVRQYSGSDGQLLGTFPTHSQPKQMLFDGTNLWVICAGDNSVSKLRASDGADEGNVVVGPTPSGLAFDGTYLYVLDIGGPIPTVTKVRASDNAVVATFAVAGSAQAIAFDGSNLDVTGHGAVIEEVTTTDGTLVKAIQTGQEPDAIVVAGPNLWVTNISDKTVSEFRASDLVKVGTFPVGGNPAQIAYDGTNIWVTNRADDTVTELRASDGAILATFNVGYYPQGLTVAGNHVLVANLDATVSQLS